MPDNNRYQSAFSHIRASDTLRTEVLNMKPEPANVRRPRRPLRPVLVAAILLCILVGSAFAVALNGNLLPYFEEQWKELTGTALSEDQNQLITGMTTELGDRVVAGDNAMTLESVIVGENAVWVLTRLEAPDAAFSPDARYDVFGFDGQITPAAASSGYGFSVQSSTVNADGSLSMLMLFSAALDAETALNSGDYCLELDFEAVIDNSGTPHTTVAEGPWHFSIPLDAAEPEQSRTLENLIVPAQIEVPGSGSELVTVELTDPVVTSTGLRFSYVGENTAMLTIAAELHDGTVVPAAVGLAGLQGTGSEWHAAYQWKLPLNPNDIAALRFGDTVIPIA